MHQFGSALRMHPFHRERGGGGIDLIRKQIDQNLLVASFGLEDYWLTRDGGANGGYSYLHQHCLVACFEYKEYQQTRTKSYPYRPNVTRGNVSQCRYLSWEGEGWDGVATDGKRWRSR